MKLNLIITTKFLFAILITIFITNSAKAGPCLTTIASASTNQLACADDDILNVTSAGSITYNDHKAVDLEDETGVQITNDGTIETEDGTNKQKAIHAESSLNTTITNNGTINSDNNEGIYIDYAENITITNNAGATISAEAGNAIEGRNVGWCDKAGNNENCQSSLSSSGSTEVGLILHNHGMISATQGTILLGTGGGGNPRSRGVKIYNYDGGTIKSTSGNNPIIAKYLTDSEIINYEGGTIESAGRYGILAENGSNITIDNRGTITSDRNTIYCRECSGVTFTNSGTISSSNTGTNTGTVLIDRQGDSDAAHTITNSGTIESASGAAIQLARNTGGTTIDNTGTITSSTGAIGAGRTKNLTINNHGTITSTGENNTDSFGIGFGNDSTSVEAGENVVLNNFGTISAINGDADGIKIGDYHANKNFDGLTINNSGTISGGDNSIVMANSNNTGLEIVTKGDGTYLGEIELNSTTTTMTLDCSISKDQKIEIHNKTNMVITNNLCGNDTYEILDSNSDLDADNSETNGFLYVYGEDLDIDSHNKKYRTEIFLSNLNSTFDSVIDNKENSFFSSKKSRNNIYSSSENGASGFFKNYINTNYKPFISYSLQNVDFNNKEKINTENLYFGFKKEFSSEKFISSVIPMIGIVRNNVTDLETETNQTIKKQNFSHLAAINLKTTKTKRFENNKNLIIEIDGKYGVHRLPSYLSSFTDGDLSVSQSVDQVLAAGFKVKYSHENQNGFIIEPYSKFSLNKTLSNDISIVGDGESKNAVNIMDDAILRKVGLNVTKKTTVMNLNLNIQREQQGDLSGNKVQFSMSKKLQRLAKIKRLKERADPELEKLFDQLQLVKENERIAELAGKLNEENRIMKDLIIQLIKDNQKLKTENNLLIKNIKDLN